MIRIDQLHDSDRGRWVEYCSATGRRELGRIKSWDRTFVFVVFKCDEHWNDYRNYTAAATLPEELSWEGEHDTTRKRGRQSPS